MSQTHHKCEGRGGRRAARRGEAGDQSTQARTAPIAAPPAAGGTPRGARNTRGRGGGTEAWCTAAGGAADGVGTASRPGGREGRRHGERGHWRVAGAAGAAVAANTADWLSPAPTAKPSADSGHVGQQHRCPRARVIPASERPDGRRGRAPGRARVRQRCCAAADVAAVPRSLDLLPSHAPLCDTLCSLARPVDLRTRRHVPVCTRQHTAVAHGSGHRWAHTRCARAGQAGRPHRGGSAATLMPGPSQPGGQLAGAASGRHDAAARSAAGPGRAGSGPHEWPAVQLVGARTRRRSPTNASRS